MGTDEGEYQKNIEHISYKYNLKTTRTQERFRSERLSALGCWHSQPHPADTAGEWTRGDRG